MKNLDTLFMKNIGYFVIREEAIPRTYMNILSRI